MLYPHILAAHGALRWIVLAAGIVAVIMAASGWSGRRPVTPALRRWSAMFVVALDVQFLLGLILYLVVSPVTRMAFQDMRAAMKIHELRFFAVEHTTYMVLAVVFAHVGSAVARRAGTDRAKYRGATIFYTLALALIIAGTPWWRPLFRFGG